MPRLSVDQRTKRLKRISISISSILYENGITQKYLSEKIGLSENTMSRRMIHPETFSIGEIMSIANILNVSMERIIGGLQ